MSTSRVLPRAGIALALLLLGGSVIGGISLATSAAPASPNNPASQSPTQDGATTAAASPDASSSTSPVAPSSKKPVPKPSAVRTTPAPPQSPTPTCVPGSDNCDTNNG
jgi:hypothetical protein